MQQTEYRSHFKGATLIVAPLGWDCFAKVEDGDFLPYTPEEPEDSPED